MGFSVDLDYKIQCPQRFDALPLRIVTCLFVFVASSSRLVGVTLVLLPRSATRIRSLVSAL
jgi:hypothetical protein